MAGIGTTLQRRVTAALTKYGSGYVYKVGLSTFSATGRLAVLAYGSQTTLFLRSQTDAWQRPIFYMDLPATFTVGGSLPQVGDLVSLPSMSDPNGADVDYTIRRVWRPRIGGVALYTRVYLALDI